MIQYTTKLQREIQALKIELTLANHAHNELSLSQSAMALDLAQTKEDFWKVHKERTEAERELEAVRKERDAYFDRLHEVRADKARLVDALNRLATIQEYASDALEIAEQLLTELEVRND